MPKALERKLERGASKEGLKGKRKDAYVYGTLRKTGWKPEREAVDKSGKKRIHSMSTQANRLIQLNSRLDKVIHFDDQYGDPNDPQDRRRHPILGDVAKATVAAGGLGAGLGGLYAAGTRSAGVPLASTAGAALSDVTGGAAGFQRAGSMIGAGAYRTGSYLGALGKTAAGGIADKAGIRAILAKLGALAFDSRKERIIALNGRLSRVIRFKAADA